MALSHSNIDQVRKVTDDDIGIKVLYEPPLHETARNIPSIDIVAIHGIGAHPDDTWRKKVNAGSPDEHYVNWLSDAHMLPAAIPSARIMRYGYESQWAGDETIKLKASTVAQRLLHSVRRMRKQYPSRPLIFIAHCFGRLVVLKAVVDAKHSDSKWDGIYPSICGLLFLGTPFRGAGGLNHMELLRAIQSQYEHDQVQGSNFNILHPGNETLMDLMDTFFETRQQRYKAYLACFFEQKPSNVGTGYKRQPNTQEPLVAQKLPEVHKS
ncbi:hypothetical protein MMC29_000878 [Sticta canariensis]|nr:hypothetical protein [Sticta canariensis]